MGSNLELQISASSPTEQSTLVNKKEEKQDNTKADSAESPKQLSAMEKWSYFEGDDIETCEASNGQTFSFRKENKTPRKIYFSLKINRFSDIDTVRESFRARYHL